LDGFVEDISPVFCYDSLTETPGSNSHLAPGELVTALSGRATLNGSAAFNGATASTGAVGLDRNWSKGGAGSIDNRGEWLVDFSTADSSYDWVQRSADGSRSA